MSLTDFGTSNTRYKFYVNIKYRTNRFFWMKNTYMAGISEHTKITNNLGIFKRNVRATRHQSRNKKKNLENAEYSFTMNYDVN